MKFFSFPGSGYSSPVHFIAPFLHFQSPTSTPTSISHPRFLFALKGEVAPHSKNWQCVEEEQSISRQRQKNDSPDEHAKESWGAGPGDDVQDTLPHSLLCFSSRLLLIGKGFREDCRS